MKTKAIVFREKNKPSLEELESPALRTGEVRVRTQFSGVSIGTESSIFSGVRTHNGTFPLVGGYMASGVVEELGPDVEGLAVGDRVAASGSRLEGDVKGVFGGHVSLSVSAAARVTKIPAGARMEDAAMFILPRVGLNAVSMAGINEQDRVVIVGQGLIGQFFGQFARARGALVITAEPSELRARLSRLYVTEHVINPLKEDLAARVNEITAGKGATVVVEATASKANIASTAKLLRSRGRMVFLSWYPGEIALDYHTFHAAEATAFFPMGAGDSQTSRAVLDCMASGRLAVGENLTDLLPYTKACEGYQRIIDGDRSIMGMVFDWRGA